MNELLGAVYSPWTERARWALDARGVPYTFRAYAPLVGELGLRRKLGQWRGPVSVPVLTTEAGEVVSDSVAIARWAAARGAGPDLFPVAAEAEMARWTARADAGLDAGRARSLTRVLATPSAAAELVPKRVRAVLGPLASTVGRLGVARTRRKYGGARVDDATHARVLDGVLGELRAALGGRATILPAFSFADITMAQVVAYLRPPSFGLRLGQASRAAFGDDELAARYADLIAWRDALYDAHRPRATR